MYLKVKVEFYYLSFGVSPACHHVVYSNIPHRFIRVLSSIVHCISSSANPNERSVNIDAAHMNHRHTATATTTTTTTIRYGCLSLIHTVSTT